VAIKPSANQTYSLRPDSGSSAAIPAGLSIRLAFELPPFET
jgi:hypothetical protein